MVSNWLGLYLHEQKAELTAQVPLYLPFLSSLDLNNITAAIARILTKNLPAIWKSVDRPRISLKRVSMSLK